MASKHYKDVPAAWKPPFGPWRQAPQNCGGEWWYINPFEGPEPWARECTDFVDPKVRIIPEGFTEIFGLEPLSEDYHDKGPGAFAVALNSWVQELFYFKQAGYPLNNLPDWDDESLRDFAVKTFIAWDMGVPSFYEHRYGWLCRFPESQLPDFQSTVYAAVYQTHQEIAAYQVRLSQVGLRPGVIHPFVPPRIFGGEDIDIDVPDPKPDHPGPGKHNP